MKKLALVLFLGLASIVNLNAQEIKNVHKKIIYEAKEIGGDKIFEYNDGRIVWLFEDSKHNLDYKTLRFENLEQLNLFLKYLEKVAETEGDVSMQHINDYYPQSGGRLDVSKSRYGLIIWITDSVTYYKSMSLKTPLKIYKKINN